MILYSESPSRFLVEVAPENRDAFIAAMGDLPMTDIGELTEIDRVIIRDRRRKEYINESLYELKEAWQAPLR